MYFLIFFLHGVSFIYFCPAFLPFTFSCLRNVFSPVVFFKRPTNLSRSRFSQTIKKQQLTLLLYANDCLKLFLLFSYYNHNERYFKISPLLTHFRLKWLAKNNKALYKILHQIQTVELGRNISVETLYKQNDT